MSLTTVYTIIYGICLFISLFCLAVTASSRSGEFQQRLLKYLVCCNLMMIGYWFSIQATTGPELVIAKRLIMAGGSFTYFFAFLCIAHFCRVKINPLLKSILALIAIIIGAAVFTFDLHQATFTEFTVSGTDGILTFSAKNAIFFYLYRIQFYAYGIAMCVVTFIGIHKSHSKRRSLHQLLTLFVPIVPGFIDALEIIIKPTYELVPVSFAMAIIFMMYLVYGRNIYGIDDQVRDEAFNKIEAALISINLSGRFQSCNPLALKLFPELANLSYNEPLDDERFSVINEFLRGEKREIMVDGRVYENDLHTVTEYGKTVGYIIWLNDITSHREMVKFMWEYQEELEKMVDDKTKHIIEIQSHVLLSMSDIIENRDGNTGGHVKRTSDIVSLLVNAIKNDGVIPLDEKFLQCVSTTAPLHDLGKLAISDTILCKPGKLTDEEFSIMKTHSAKGASMVDTVLNGVEDESVLEIARNIAKYHHERWDGRGYPEALAGEDIPIEARIMAIADVYDALVSKRCYKEPMSFEKADSIILESFGNAFDPALKKYYEECRPKMEEYYRATY